MTRGILTIFTILLILLFTTSAWGASSYQMIEQAYQNGDITQEEKLVLAVQSIKDQQGLPLGLQSTEIEVGKCATEILIEVHQYWDNFSTENQTFLKDMMARPSRTFTYNSPSGIFKIHYNTSGVDGVPTADVSPSNGIPDYIDWVADYIDSSYRTIVDVLGHRTPPSDNGLGGDTRYDIYTEDMPYYGYTQPENNGPEAWNDATSYISVHNDFFGFPPNDDPDGNQKGAAKVTCIHEYYHAVQFAYDFLESLWMMESAATWMEDFGYDVVNDNYNYLDDFMSVPYYSLHYGQGIHPYGAFLWETYIHEKFGESNMHPLWEELRYNTAYQGLATIFGNNGTNLEDEFAEFGIWNYITGSRDDGLHYVEASFYSIPPTQKVYSSYPVIGGAPSTTHRPDAMSTNYIKFTLPAAIGDFTVDFFGDDTTPWRVHLLVGESTGGWSYDEYEMTLDGVGDGTFTLPNSQNFEQLIMVVSNVSQTLNNRTYTFNATHSPAQAYGIDLFSNGDGSVYSNNSTVIQFTVQNTGTESDVFDFVASDTLGWTITPAPLQKSMTSTEVYVLDVIVNSPPLADSGFVNWVELIVNSQNGIGITDTAFANVFNYIQHGDADNSGDIDVSDAVYLIAYIFAGGPAPLPSVEAGDADCNGSVDVSDAVFIIAYIFSGGPIPPCNVI